MDRMIERVARAIQDEGPVGCCVISDEHAETLARAAVEAMREPNDAMEQGYYASCDEHGMVLWKTGYRAMLDAALSEPPSSQGSAT